MKKILGALRAKWIDGHTLTKEEIEDISANRDENPDRRIRKSAATLLTAISGQPDGHAAHLLEMRNFHQLKKRIKHFTFSSNH